MFLVRVTVVVPVVVELVSVLVEIGKLTSTLVESLDTFTATSVAAVLTSSTATTGADLSSVVNTVEAVAVLPSESVIVATTV